MPATVSVMPLVIVVPLIVDMPPRMRTGPKPTAADARRADYAGTPFAAGFAVIVLPGRRSVKARAARLYWRTGARQWHSLFGAETRENLPNRGNLRTDHRAALVATSGIRNRRSGGRTACR